ncbi:MAG: histidine kinase [Bacteroidia bacterium]|nr:histidine kinase [Bacteroidia bacterium]
MSKGGFFWRYKLHHVTFWTVYFIFWTAIYRSSYPSIWPLIVVVSLYMVFLAISFYTTAYYLIPRFLYPRRFLVFSLLTASLFIVTSAGLAASLFMYMRPYIPKETTNAFQFIVAGAFSSNIIFTGAMCAVKLIVDRMRMDQERKRVEKHHLESELQYLKAQVNPHFLFNAINSVYFLIKRNPDQAAQTLIRLSDLLRFQLYDCSGEMIDIRKEIEYLENFVALEEIRKGPRVTVDFKVGEDVRGFGIAPFLMIPFLENAFKFVSSYNDRENQVKVFIARHQNKMTAEFFNTCEYDHNESVGGIGLKNVARRLELLYPDRHALVIEKMPDAYRATLTLQLDE